MGHDDRRSSRPPRRRDGNDRRPDDTAVAEPDPGRLSRFLALVLRHRAYQFDLQVDDEGFVSMEELLEVMQDQRNLTWVTQEDVDKLLAEQERKRFELVDGNIRATYGHSFRKPILYKSIEPPARLFIGLPRPAANDARVSGLGPTGRQYVHLSANSEEALKLGHIHDPGAILVTVRADDAAANGIQFHEPAEGLFLVARIPAEYLEIEVRYGRGGRKKKRR